MRQVPGGQRWQSFDEIVVIIDGAHIRVVPGHPSRRLDLAVGKVETAGRPTRRFAWRPWVPSSRRRRFELHRSNRAGDQGGRNGYGPEAGQQRRRLIIWRARRSISAASTPTLWYVGVCFTARRSAPTWPIMKVRSSTTAPATWHDGRSRPRRAERTHCRPDRQYRMAKRQSIRWSPRGTHCVVTVCAAVVEWATGRVGPDPTSRQVAQVLSIAGKGRGRFRASAGLKHRILTLPESP